MELLERIRKAHPETTVVMITAFGTVQTAVEAMKAGAYDYITKPIDYEELVLVVNRALEHQRLVEEVRTLRGHARPEVRVREHHRPFARRCSRVLEMASRVAQRDSTVLIRGETGTGKELLARAIHQNSRRKNSRSSPSTAAPSPRTCWNRSCSATPRDRSPARWRPRRGKVEMADGGTLFLDEIGEMPIELQVKLLRLIQQGEIEKVGATSR